MTKARCNPLWQPIPCPLSDIEGLESWLGDMAAQGLVPVTIGQNFARFRCSQPKAVRYRLNAKPMRSGAGMRLVLCYRRGRLFPVRLRGS